MSGAAALGPGPAFWLWVCTESGRVMNMDITTLVITLGLLFFFGGLVVFGWVLLRVIGD